MRNCTTLQQSYYTQYGAITFNINKCLSDLHVRMSMQTNLQHVFKMSASRMHACFESHTPLVNVYYHDVLFNAAPNVQQTLSQLVNISNLCLVDTLLH